ncbi:unnamed protein product, partial [Mesorhabditis belari]|uniref:Zinc finger CCCH domain-containing protein 14 n=1 Tax=Mesorhabditis belari TaxID=2138241 RepID=A0AAF3F134_9BILA
MSTTDIQKKLKAAIARRLKELDVYVEDELPDYVMVMVANKKEKKAMRSDLSLFLGANTDTFVDWLFDVMAKLHSASGKTETKPVAQKTRDPSPSRDKEKLKEKERKAKEESERAEREKERKERERRHKEEQEKAERKAKKEREEKLEEERKRNKEKELRRLEKEKEEREKEKERERQRQQREAEERSRHEERHHKHHRNRRDRSNTWSDDEDGVRPRYRVASVVEKLDTEHPMPTVSSRIVVKRKPQPVNDTKSARGATSILQRAVAAANQSANNRSNQASTSKRPCIANRVDYGSRSESEPRTDDDEQNDDEAMLMAAVGAAQSKAVSSTNGPTKFIITMKQSQHPRNVQKRHIKQEDEKKDVAMEPTKDKRPRHMRISAPDETYVPPPRYVEKKKALVALNFSPVKPLAQSSPKKEKLHLPVEWNGKIKLDAESSDDDEAQIDAVLASTRRVIPSARGDGDGDGEQSDEELPPTVLLSRGNSYSGNYSPVQTPTEAIYVPTPIQKGPSPEGSSPILMDSMMQYTTGTSTQNHVNKANGKCKYWPNCTRGFSCGFVHPSKACSAFPNCTFGSSCLYIHPVCRFNAQCKNTSCSFTHSETGTFPAAVLALSSQPSYNRPSAIVRPMMKTMSTYNATNPYQENSQDYTADLAVAPKVPTVPCIYGAGCRNSQCTFKHPPACKFGYSCYNASCAFYHGPAQQSTAASAVPIQAHRQSGSRTQYTWKAN